MIKLYLTAVITLVPFIVRGMEHKRVEHKNPSLKILLCLEGPYKLSKHTNESSALIEEEGKNELPIELEGHRAKSRDETFHYNLYTNSQRTKPAHWIIFHLENGKLKANFRSLRNPLLTTSMEYDKKNAQPTLTLCMNKHAITSMYFGTKAEDVQEHKSKEKKVWVAVKTEPEEDCHRRLLGNLLDELDGDPFKDLPDEDLVSE